MEASSLKKHPVWLGIGGSLMFLLWTAYYCAMRLTGGVWDARDRLVCGAVAAVCAVFLIRSCVLLYKARKERKKP